MGSGPARTGEVAILVPYRNRKAYLDIFLREVPKYLQRANGISDYVIYVAEQQSQDLFNLALSRNVAARAALDDGMFGYFVFHDVDVIPLCGVDYGSRGFNVAWFLSAGSCKVMVADFVRANGYNPDFVGWGDEDVEFYHRLEHLGRKVREWHRMPESRQAVVVNLEWPEISDDEALSWSRRYFGHGTRGLGSFPTGPAVAASNGTTNRGTSSDQISRSATTLCGTECTRCLQTKRPRTSLGTG